MQEIENFTVLDWPWNEIEYGIPDTYSNRKRLKRLREAYEEAERGEQEYEHTI